MRTPLRLAALTIASLAALAAGSSVAGSALAAPATCSSASPVAITSFAFDPPAVAPGHSSTATLVLQNCTRQPVPTRVQWQGRFIGTGTGQPAGCPRLDPLLLPVTLPAAGRAQSAVGFLVPARCTAHVLRVGVLVTGSNGALLAAQTADLAIAATDPPPPGR